MSSTPANTIISGRCASSRTQEPGRHARALWVGPISIGQWYHVALVADSNRRSLYIDGVLQGYADLLGPDAEPLNRGVVTFGANRGMQAEFHGLLDETNWYERVPRLLRPL